MRNGAKRHIDAINKLLPGSILVIKDYFAGLSRDVTPTTRANYLICVKAAVKDYFAERYYTDYALRMNIDFFFKSITPKRDRRSRATFLSEEIIKKLIAESGLRTSLWIQNLYTIGRRVSELCDLKWSNITQESDDLAVATVKQKGGNWDIFRIPMKLLELNRSVFRGKEYVLPNRYGEKNTRQNILLLCHHAGKTVLGYTVHPHVFRHSFASHQVRNNPGKIRAIMAQGGWSDARVFIGTYCHDQLKADDFRLMPQASTLAKYEGEAGGLSITDFFGSEVA